MVVGDKGTSESQLVWDWIAGHRWPGWTLEVLTADESQIDWGSAPQAQEWTPPWVRAGVVPEAVSVTYLRVGSDPRPMLAARSEADLIVVGRSTDRRSPSLGSTGEWLLHHPPSSLAVISTSDPVRTVVICVDGSDHAYAALETFSSLPLADEARVTVLGVEDGRSEAAAAVEEAAGRLADRVAQLDTELVKGAPTRAILGHLDSARPDLVVLGTKGLTGWKRIRLGSTAGAVVRSASCNRLVGASEI